MTMTDIVSLLAAVSGFVATFYWYRASKVPVKAAWDYDSTLKPKNMIEDAWGLANALERALMIASDKNTTAALWTAISVGLSALATMLAKLL
jgi:hypothetical protein